MYNYAGKKILITGAYGLIGSHLGMELLKIDNVNVYALGRDESKLRCLYSEYLDSDKFSYIVGDVSDIHLPDIPFDIIFHAAGPMERGVIDNSPLEVIRPNIIGTMNLFEDITKIRRNYGINCRVIIFSSVSVYQNYSNSDIVVNEDDTDVVEKLSGSNIAYSYSKRMSEVISTACRMQYDVDYVAARLSTVYGDTFYRPKTAFFQFLEDAIDGKDITIKSSAIPRRDNIYIDDAVMGLLEIGINGISGEAYNISSNGNLNNFAAIDEIADVFLDEAYKMGVAQRRGQLLIDGNASLSRRPGIRLNNEKLKGLGWSINVGMKEGVRNTISSYIGRK